MSSFFGITVEPSGAAIEAVESTDFDRSVTVSNTNGSAVRVGFTESEVTSGYLFTGLGEVSLILPAGHSLWIYNTNAGFPAYVLVSGSP